MWSISTAELVLDSVIRFGSVSMRIVLTVFPTALAVGLSLLLCGAAPPERMLEKITFDDDGKSRTISGRVVVKAQDGGLLVQERDGRLWTVTAEVLEKRVTTTNRSGPRGSTNWASGWRPNSTSRCHRVFT
ncbi:MAG: hypothetical protein CM1200mP2_50910 [Planctomycetaceae bacterium]|nr:MAG: hypothetical protein CM1200mP2_50910 [Planctomycetaceae bacterium]